ncbi:hypothetical protein D9M68_916180 [compost metagenome]
MATTTTAPTHSSMPIIFLLLCRATTTPISELAPVAVAILSSSDFISHVLFNAKDLQQPGGSSLPPGCRVSIGYLLVGVTSSFSSVSRTNTASRRAGFVSLAFALTW